MAEPTVQLPVSMLKRIYGGSVGLDDLRDMAVLLSQATPLPEDMAPGTTFRAAHINLDPEGQTRLWVRMPWGALDVMTDERFKLRVIDPSTIRDVTPPTESTK